VECGLGAQTAMLGTMMSRAARAVALLASAGLILATPVAAHAGKPFAPSEPYSFTDSFDEPDFCGIAVHFEVEGSGVSHVLPVKGSDGQAFLAFDNYEFTEVITTQDGSIRTNGNGSFHEQKATHISGDIWEFQFVDAGTFRVYDSDGNLLLRSTGVFKASEQFDTFGDSQPGGEPVPDTFEVVAQHGQSFTDEEFCAAVLPELT
jgi:hypothetical protein